MGSRGSSSSREQTSEKGLRERAEGIHRILKESGMPAKQSVEQTVEMLRQRDKDNAVKRMFNKKPDPEIMDSTSVYREIDRTTRKIETTYNQKQVDSFKKNYNNARSKYSKGDVAGAEKLLAKIPTEYVRYRALDEYMYGDPGNMRKVRFYKEYH